MSEDFDTWREANMGDLLCDYAENDLKKFSNFCEEIWEMSK